MISNRKPICPDCNLPMLPKPTRYQDGCWIRPLYCLWCREEKAIAEVVIVERRDDDLHGQAVAS